jgi:hypothetical protein
LHLDWLFSNPPEADYNRTIKTLTCGFLPGRWPKIQATRYADGR